MWTHTIFWVIPTLWGSLSREALITTPQRKNPNGQVGRGSSFHRPKVGRGSVLPTDLVGHRKSGPQRSFPTDKYLPTDCLTVLENLSRPTFDLPTVITFPTNLFFPTNYPTPYTFANQQFVGPIVN
jgi:hypothetical protein